MQRLSDSISASNVAPQNAIRSNANVQSMLNRNEDNSRESIVNENIYLNSIRTIPSKAVISPPPVGAASASQKTARPAKSAAPREFIQTTIQNTNLEMMNPIWLDKDLFLVRRAYIGKQEYIQGCWLDWPGIRAMLLKRVEDLLPHADLAPLQSPASGRRRLLASIPALLIPGTAADEPHEGWTILKASWA